MREIVVYVIASKQHNSPPQKLQLLHFQALSLKSHIMSSLDMDRTVQLSMPVGLSIESRQGAGMQAAGSRQQCLLASAMYSGGAVPAWTRVHPLWVKYRNKGQSQPTTWQRYILINPQLKGAFNYYSPLWGMSDSWPHNAWMACRPRCFLHVDPTLIILPSLQATPKVENAMVQFTG